MAILLCKPNEDLTVWKQEYFKAMYEKLYNDVKECVKCRSIELLWEFSYIGKTSKLAEKNDIFSDMISDNETHFVLLKDKHKKSTRLYPVDKIDINN